MNHISIIPNANLSSLIQSAANKLANATTAAEILDTADTASIIYDASKKAAQMAKAKGAHDEVVAAAHRAQADALEIEAKAKRRLDDEYDAAQKRGEIARHGQKRADVPEGNISDDLGISRKQIHEARIIRDAEQIQPGIVRQTLDNRLENKQEPTKTAMREAVVAAAMRGMRRKGLECIEEAKRLDELYRAVTAPNSLFEEGTK